MPGDDFVNQLPPDLKNMIGKTVQRKLPNGKIIKFVVGDVTGDGKVDADDIEILRLLCQGGATAEALFSHMTPEQMAACDTDGDGYINKNDLVELCKKVILQSGGPKASESKLANLRNNLRNKGKE